MMIAPIRQVGVGIIIIIALVGYLAILVLSVASTSGHHRARDNRRWGHVSRVRTLGHFSRDRVNKWRRPGIQAVRFDFDAKVGGRGLGKLVGRGAWAVGGHAEGATST